MKNEKQVHDEPKNKDQIRFSRSHEEQLGNIGVLAIFIILTVFNMITGKPNDAPQAMFWMYFAAQFLPLYKATKNKLYLFTVAVSILASILSLISYMLG